MGSARGLQTFAVDFWQSVKALLLRPTTEFERLATEPESLGELTLRWIAPLTLLMVLGNTVGVLIAGVPAPGGYAFHPDVTSVPWLVLPLWLEAVAMPFVAGGAIMLTAGFFGGIRDYRQATRTAAFVSTPGWLVNILGPGWSFHTEGYTFNPSPGPAMLAGAVWGVYLLWRALPAMVKVPPGRALAAAGLMALVLAMLWSLAFLVTYGTITALMDAYMESLISE